MYEERITLKPDSPKLRLAKQLISPAFGWHARLVSLLLNSSSFVFVSRSGKSIISPTVHCK